MVEENEPQLPGIETLGQDRFEQADSLLQYLSAVDPEWVEQQLTPIIANLKYVHQGHPKPYLRMAWGNLRLRLANYIDPFDPEKFSYEE